jgi:hypothetical protein
MSPARGEHQFELRAAATAQRPRSRAFWLTKSLLAGAVAAAACGNHAVPQQPTWADVEPIVRGSCTQCHGSNAGVAASGYRFDFYDMTADVCGEAAAVLNGQSLAQGLAPDIGMDVTPPGSDWRPRMPPAPAPVLEDWQRDTLERWAANPLRGSPSRDDHRPDIQLQATTAAADKSSTFTAVVTDADGEPVVGVLHFGDTTLYMDRAGSFGTTVDTSKWTEGYHPISATLCDGWDNVSYDLGYVAVSHAPSPAANGGAGGAK